MSNIWKITDHEKPIEVPAIFDTIGLDVITVEINKSSRLSQNLFLKLIVCRKVCTLRYVCPLLPKSSSCQDCKLSKGE